MAIWGGGMIDHDLPYLVWCPEKGYPRIRHATLDAAIAESERLAKQNPGFKFYPMKPSGVSFVFEPVVYQPFDELIIDQTPF